MPKTRNTHSSIAVPDDSPFEVMKTNPPIWGGIQFPAGSRATTRIVMDQPRTANAVRKWLSGTVETLERWGAGVGWVPTDQPRHCGATGAKPFIRNGLRT